MIHKTQIVIATALVVLAAIPTTLFLMQEPQDTRTRASASTTLEYAPNASVATPLQKKVGEQTAFDIIVNPGSNLPSLVKLEMQYDPAVFTPATTPFVVNAAAFPTTIEGPVVISGKVLISVSIGSDSTKAIQAPTKVGTLYLVTKAVTTGAIPSEVSFGSRSQVLSLAKSDESNENVLSTTTPSYVTIAQAVLPSAIPSPTTIAMASLTPTQSLPTGAPSPTRLPSMTQAPLIIPSSTIIPTQTPIPTQPSNPGSTKIALNVLLHGIGSSGDNANPFASDTSNKTPQQPTRTVTASLYNDQNTLVTTKTGNVTYDTVSGSYKGTVDLGTSFATGDYMVRIKEDTHLRRLIPGIQRITATTNNVLPDAVLIAGDVNGDNILNILDYNIVVGCYSDLLPAISCTDDQKIKADLNDNASVNQFDYNLFLREITVQSGN